MIEICGLSGQAIKNKKIQLNYFLKNMRTDGLWYFSLENSRERRRKRQRLEKNIYFVEWRRRMIIVFERIEKINLT